MTEVFFIEYPPTPAGKKHWAKEYGMNKYYAGTHWSVRKRDADYWHALTKACMEKAGLRRVPFQKPVIVTFWWNDKLDIDNHAIMGKFIVDAMKGRLLKEDNRRWLKGVCHYWHDADYIKVEVREVEV